MSELKKSQNHLNSALMVLLLMLSMGPLNALAFQSRLDAFQVNYPDWPTDTAHQCATCHSNNTSGGSSPYRADFIANGFDFTAVENLDSDNDGVKNIDEISVGFHPSWKAGDTVTGVNISAFLTPQNDMTLSIAAPAAVVLGTNITYVLTVENDGPQDATSVVLSNTLPANVNFVSSDPSQGSCSQNSGVVSCSLGRINNNGSATISIAVETTTLGTQVNNASVTAGQIELNNTDNLASSSTDVSQPVTPPTNPPNGGIAFFSAIISLLFAD